MNTFLWILIGVVIFIIVLRIVIGLCSLSKKGGEVYDKAFEQHLKDKTKGGNNVL